MSEQIYEPRDNIREESVRSAMKDISLIRRMIDHTEINMHRLSLLFLVLGPVSLAYSLFRLFSTLIVSRTGSRFLKITSAVLIILLIALYTCGISPEGIRTSETDYSLQLAGIANMKSSFASLIQVFIYLGMGIYCIVKQRGPTHGDE